MGSIFIFFSEKVGFAGHKFAFWWFVAWKYRYVNALRSFTCLLLWNVSKTSKIGETFIIIRVGNFVFYSKKWEIRWGKSGVGSAVVACCGEMPVWKHKKCLYVQHNTQVHTQPKIAKIAQNTQKYTSFRAYFGRFRAYFGRFTAEKKIMNRFRKSGLLKELCQPINDGGFSRFVQFF